MVYFKGREMLIMCKGVQVGQFLGGNQGMGGIVLSIIPPEEISQPPYIVAISTGYKTLLAFGCMVVPTTKRLWIVLLLKIFGTFFITKEQTIPFFNEIHN